MTSVLSVIILLAAVLYESVAPPVTKNKENADQGPSTDGLENYMEYHRYLREVVTALESDPEFKRKLEKADEADIRSGKIADELELVSHHVRSRLDEIKRAELVRLRELTKRKQDLMDNNSIDDPVHHHLDQHNEHTFEIEDLRKLIFKTTQDLAEADRRRRDEFKQYELQKEYEKQQKLNHTNGEEREKLELQFKELEEKHKKHEKLHEPGHKQQLEEVWEKQDHMQQNFDPKTFFMLHDLDGNGMWDETEVKALFIKELDKMYAAGAPEDDMRERAEEMERMRESVFAEVDVNKDGFIDYNEFIAQTKRNDFQQDHGWKGLDEQQPPYTNEELEEYIRIHEAQRAQYNQMPPPGMGHPGQIPPGYQQPGGYQIPPGGYQVPPGGYQVPPGGYQVPPGAYHPNDIYGNPHDQVAPPPNQLHPGQLPQTQVNPQQIYHQKVPQSQGGVPHPDVRPIQVNQNPNQQFNQPNAQSGFPNQPSPQQVQQNVQYNPPPNQPSPQQVQQNVQYNPPPNQPNVQPSPVQQQNVPNPAVNVEQNNLPPQQNVPPPNHPNNLDLGQNIPQVQKT